MHLSTYLLLVGAAVLVTQLTGTADSKAIGTQVEDGESTAALDRTSSSEDSAEEEEEDDVEQRTDSSEEKDSKVKRSAQFSRNSDEFDNFSIEIDNRRPVVVGAAQPTPAAVIDVRNPVFIRNSDERIDASDELRSVLATRVRPIAPTRTAFANSGRLPLVPLGFRNLVRQQSDDFDDDISIEIRDRVAVTPVIQQQVVSTLTVTSGRLPAPRNPSILVRQSDDDFDDVSLEIVRQQVAPTPVRQVVSPTQTGLPSRLPVPMGFRTQVVRESDGDLSLEVVRVTPNQQPTVNIPSPNNNNNPAAANIRTVVVSQSDERDDVSVEILGSLVNRNAGQLPTAPLAAQTSAIRPIQQANNRQQPIQTFNRVDNVAARPAAATARPQVQQPPVTTPITRPATVASASRLPLVPLSFRNPILVRQSTDFDDDISIEIRDRVAPTTTLVVQQVVAQTQTSDRLPVPMSFRNPILRQSDDFDDDVSIEIRDRNVLTAPQQVNRPAVTAGQTLAPIINNANRPEFVVITQDADGDVSLELVSNRVQQPAAGVANQSVRQEQQQQGFSISPVRPLVPPRPVAAQTGNQGQRVTNVFNDFSLEEEDDDDDDDDDFFLEDQFDNIDGFRLLASDFFAQPPGNGGFPVVRSVENQRKTAQQEEMLDNNSAELVSLADSDFHVPAATESDDWFLVKQYMDHDYSSEELEGELAREYFWQPVKDAKKVKTDKDKMAELKPTRS